MNQIKGLVIDINGVLHDEEKPIGNSVLALNQIKLKYPVRLISNSTSKSRKQVAETLILMGFHITENEIFTPLSAISSFLKSKNAGAFFISTEKTKTEFADIPKERIDYVVVTHAHENFTFENLNQGFRYLLQGAELLGSGYSKYYKDKDGRFNLDPGPFIKALEFASSKQAIILGKPSKEFFLSAVLDMGLDPAQAAMIGDDIETDVKGGMDSGLQGILVKTGKFQEKDLMKDIKPDFILEKFDQISQIL